MNAYVKILGAGLAGSECALQLADRGVRVSLVEMRPTSKTAVHATDRCAELVCSNSLKSTNPESAAGMLKSELAFLHSHLYQVALRTSVAAGGALAVDRDAFSSEVTNLIHAHPLIEYAVREATDLCEEVLGFDALVVATGPLTSDALAASVERATGAGSLAFFDAAAPIVMADSLDYGKVFSQSRYEEGVGDYLNAPFDKDSYEEFIDALVDARRVIARDFETRDLFQACQPIEEIARTGRDAPRFGALKPVGLTDPNTGRRPWAAVQLRAENTQKTCYNLVGFQTNLAFPEQERVFRMIPGLEHAEFARYGVMHRNTFIDAPRLLDASLRLVAGNADSLPAPVFFAGQVAGTEGYVEAIRSGLHVALSVAALVGETHAPLPPKETAFGALLAYATDPSTVDYQPSHVNFGVMPPLDPPVKRKRERYAAYAERGGRALEAYVRRLRESGLIGDAARPAGIVSNGGGIR